MPPLDRLPRTRWRIVKDGAHALQARAARAWGRPDGGFRTTLTLNGQKVIFVHNPKAGGSSLGTFLGVRRRNHTFPRDILSPRIWDTHFSIVVVRDPFERFLSCYYGNVVRPNPNGLTKRYGMALKSLGPADFLDILAENPRYGGPQSNWTHHPGAQHPEADLILRFEDIAKWKDQMLSLGLDVGNRTLTHRNQSDRSSSNHLDRLKMTPEAFENLREKVNAHFAEDYELFGY